MKISLKDKLLAILSSRLPEDKTELLKNIKEDRKGGLIGYILDNKLITEKELLSIFSQELSIPLVDLSRYRIDSGLMNLIPERFAKQYCIMPISKIGDVLTVAINDPLNVFAYDDLKALTKCEINFTVASDKEIKDAIERNYHTEALKIDNVLEKVKEESATIKLMGIDAERIDIGEALQESQKPPIIKIVDLILAEALKKRASDIHIEPLETDLRIRYRIDGELQDILALPKKNQNAVVARLKLISGLDITEFRIPQDGRFKARILGKEIDYRVSVLPTSFGGKVVLRALDKVNLSIGLNQLGFSSDSLALFKEGVSKPYGMVLMTGPTGSGKSTTLYSVLNRLNTPERNIITVEDPVEYEIEGITQIQVRHEIGLTFASGLRSLLRQSPDVIMIGEIRDFETADIVIKASLTGQLVFSTLHTNDACGAITRLIDMGVEPFLVSASLVMTCAQRLVRKICPVCKVSVEIPKEVLTKMDIKLPKGKVPYRGKGCSRCNNTGYFGRTAIIEIVIIDDRIREMIIKGVSSDQIKEYAVKEKGMLTLRDDALTKFFNGETTLEEVLRVTTEE